MGTKQPSTATVSQGSSASPQRDDSIFSDPDESFKHVASSEVRTAESTGRCETDQLLESYYDFFHNAHPIALPQKRLLTRRKTDGGDLEHLIPVLEYIGAIYATGVSPAPFRQLAHEKLTCTDLPINGFSVQALLLFSLAIHCSDEYKVAEGYLDRAIDIALSINMHREDFAWNHSDGDPVLAESWRRTWWTLYGTDGLFAAISHYPTHRLHVTIGDVKLPCEDREYENGVSRQSAYQTKSYLHVTQRIPEPRSLTDYDNREFDDEEVIYSSFTYFIDAFRILSSMLTIQVEERGPGDRTLASVDAKFVNWLLYLPKSKLELVTKDQKVDETMFLTHIVMNWYAMLPIK